MLRERRVAARRHGKRLGRPPRQLPNKLCERDLKRLLKMARAKVTAYSLLQQGEEPQYVERLLKKAGVRVGLVDIVKWFWCGCPLRGGMIPTLSQKLNDQTTNHSQNSD